MKLHSQEISKNVAKIAKQKKVRDIINNLQKKDLEVDVYDPWVNQSAFKEEYSINVYKQLPNKKYNAIILAVAHNSFDQIDIMNLKRDDNTIVYDIKGVLKKKLTTNRL